MKDFLETLGLSTGEIALFDFLLKHGSSSPVELAKGTGVKRTTAYSMARGLVEKGLTTEDASRRPRVFIPATPEQVLALVDADKRRFIEREELYKSIAGELSKISAGKSYPVPTVRFVEEAKLETFMRQQVPVWHQNMQDVGEPEWWGFQDHTFVEHFREWIDWTWKIAFEGMGVKLLSNAAPVEREMEGKYEKRKIKFWGEATTFQSSTWICGDYVIMVNTRNHPFYLVEIHDKLMAHDQREVFRNLWPLV